MSQPPFDLNTAHRWFAVEMNNLAWELLERDGRTPEQSDTMLHAAHAACLHWRQAGTTINELRAQCLLANVYLAVDQPAIALEYAERCLELSRANPEGQNDFDRATALGCASRACAATGDDARAAEYQREALDLAMLLEQKEREVASRFIG